MKSPNSLLKVATVVSSVLLVGGFVSYRAGAFDWLTGTGARPANSESSPALDPSLLSGSKSDLIFREPANSQQPPPAAQPAPAIMSGSKSLAPAIFPPAQPDPPNAQAPSPSQPSKGPQ